MYVAAPVSHTPVPCAQLPPHPQSLLQRCHSTFPLSCTGWKMVQWHTRRECTYIFHDKCLRHDVLISQDAPALAFHLNQPADNFREFLLAIKEGASQHRQAVCPTSSHADDGTLLHKRALFLGLASGVWPGSGTHLHWGSLQGSTPCGTACQPQHP